MNVFFLSLKFLMKLKEKRFADSLFRHNNKIKPHTSTDTVYILFFKEYSKKKTQKKKKGKKLLFFSIILAT
jgi:hypothetical protein